MYLFPEISGSESIVSISRPLFGPYLRLPIFLLTALFLLSTGVHAGCSEDGVECPPANVVTGVSITRQFDMDFSSDNQAMRRQGEAASGQNNQYKKSTDLVLLKRSETQFGDKLNIDEIVGFRLFDKLDDMLGGVDLLGIDFDKVLDKLKDIFSNKDYRFGADLDVDMAGDFGFSMSAKWKEGNVDLRYPVSLNISYPDKSQFNAGGYITIDTSAVVRDGYNFITHSPDAELGMTLSGKLDTRASGKACNFSSCEDQTLWDIDVSGERYMVVLDGVAGRQIDLSDMPVDLVDFLFGFTGRFSIPRIAITNEDIKTELVTDQNTGESRYKQVLRGSDTNRFVHFEIDVGNWLLWGLAKISGKLKKYFDKSSKTKSYVFKTVDFLFTPIDLRLNTDLIKHQELTLVPDITVTYNFSSPVEWEVVDKGASVDSGNSASVTLLAGQDLKLKATDAVLPLTVTPQVTLPNNFKNEEWVERQIYGSLRILDIGIKVPVRVVFGRRCVDFWVGEVCTGKFKWRGIDEQYGPVIEKPRFLETQGELSSWRYSSGEGWELQGLQTFPLQSFDIVANSPPEVAAPIADQVVHWNTVIDIDLDTVFSDADGEALRYTVLGLPAFLQLSGNHLRGTVDRPYRGTIKILAEDGTRARASDIFDLTVAMPVVDIETPRLSMREATPPQPRLLHYRLSAEPSASVILELRPDNEQIDLGSGFGQPHQLAFDAANWYQSQPLSVTVKDDFIDEVDGNSGINAVMSSTDAGFDGGGAEKIVVQIRDNDRSGIWATPSRLLTGEGGQSDTLRLRLSSEPVQPVTLNLSVDNADEFSLDKSSLVFDSSNWNVSQFVVVSGVDDTGIQDGTYQGQINITASSADVLYTNRTWHVRAHNTDDDKAGVTITPVADLRTTEADEGSADASFRVVLDADPSATGVVTVSFTVSDSGEAQVNPASVVFDHSNWSVPQEVFLTGVDDPDQDGDQVYSVQTLISSSNAPGYDSLTDADVADVSAINIDDEQSGFLVDAAVSPLQTGEDGASSTFSLRLRSRPEADVRVAVVSANTDEGDVDKGELLFTVDDWFQWQEVVVSGVDEAVVDGDQNYAINISASSSDALYDNVVLTPSLAAVNRDDDEASILVSPMSGLKVTETGGSDQFSVVLGKQPASPVTLSVNSDGVLTGHTVPASLVFTPENWHQPQTVTVYGLNNGLDNGDRVFNEIIGPAASGPAPYMALPRQRVSVTNYGVDNASITMAASGSLNISEHGGKAVFSVQLATMPMANIRLEFSLSDGLQGEVTPDFLEFTPEDWDQPRTVTFTALDNAVIDGDRVVQLNALVPAGSGVGTAYPPGATSGTFAINIADEDAAGILVSPQADLFTSEAGETASFSVVLLAQPAADVSIDLLSSDPGEGQPDQSSLTFNSFNWAIPQTVTVTGQDDVMADADQDYQIRFQPAVSTDGHYNGLTVDDVLLTNLDDDEPGVTITPATGLVTTEDGGTAHFDVVLNTQPEGDVQFSLWVDDPGEASLGTRMLTFTSANWDQPQQITITGLDDDEVDGDQEYSIHLGLIGNGSISAYGTFEITPVQATNRDNDPVEVQVVGLAGDLHTDENGSEDQFSIALNAAPTADVSMEISVDDPGEATLVDEATDAVVASTIIVFTPDDWALPRQVLVRGVNDDIYDEDQLFHVLIKPLVSADARYNGLDPADPAGINEDNDYSPTGYVYYSGTGSLVQGGRISVNCSNGVAQIVSERDGRDGYYQFAVTDIKDRANCELSYTPPAGYRFDENCAAGSGAFSVPANASATQLGSAKDEATGKLKEKACSSNPWYRLFDITPDAGKLTHNNLPMTRGACSYDANLLRMSGSFSGEGSTILSSALGIETANDGGRVEVLAPHLLALKTPKLSIKSGTVLRVAAGARLSVAPVTDLCQ